MIKHHPKSDLLMAFVAGELPASLSAAVAIHTDMCPICQNFIAEETNKLADASFKEDSLDDVVLGNTTFEGDRFETDNVNNIDFDSMIASITGSDSIASVQASIEKVIKVKGSEYVLPKAINNMAISNWSGLGKIARARINLNEGDIHTSLLHLDAGGSVPEHTHNGYEVTLLLDGEFKDEMGSYYPGDFIMLDSDHQHNPITESGCLCYTVVSDSLHFTKGLNKLLNPIGSFIY